jgi:hypothetical protein
MCSYCGTEVPKREITQDHVIGDSWYTPRSEGLEKWKVPACTACNHRLGSIERAVLVRLGFCLNPDEAANRPIIDLAMRAIDPAAGKSQKDAAHRLALGRKIRREMKRIEQRDDPAIMASFRENFDDGSRYGLMVTNEQRRILGTKWAKGLYRYHLGQIVPAEAAIDIYDADAETEHEALGPLLDEMNALHRGPDLQVLMHHSRDDRRELVLFAIRLWERFKMQMAVTINTGG